MEQKTIGWDEATLPELIMFSSQVLGIPVAPNIGEATLRGKIRQCFPGDSITISVLETEDRAPADAPAAPSDQPTDGRALRGTSASGDPMVLITISEVDSPGGKRPVFAGVNGVGMLIPRGRPVDIPYRYYEALLHAVKTVHEQDMDTGEITSTDVLSYPVSVNQMPPQAEIDAYFAAQMTPAAA